MLKTVCVIEHTYVHRRSVDTNLHAEMRLLDKQVYIVNECFK